MSSIFSAYAYEESLLSLSNAMLDKDLFVQVDEVTKLRQMGWRPQGQVCGICRRRVWGPGTGLRIWENWEKKEKERTKRKELHRRRSATTIGEDYEDDGQEVIGKGKRRSVPSREMGSDDDGEGIPSGETDLGPLIVFSCRHLFHRKCLDQSQDPNGGETGGAPVQHGEDYGEMRLACPSCA